VFAPASVVPGDTAFVQVFAHLLEQAEEARSRAEELNSAAEPRAFRTLETVVRRGTRLTFDLDFRRLTVVDPVQSLVWNGRPASVQFSVEDSKDARPGAYVGTVAVSLESVPIGRVKFKLDVISPEKLRVEYSEPVGDDARRYKTAFVSYSSKDRQAVLERVQMLKPLGIDFFQDLLDLDPGDRWERKLYLGIDRCDLFLLWSSHAKASRWVRNEAQYALDRKGEDELGPPEIRPVIIEGPPIPPPWPELAHLHFGDRLVYIMAGSDQLTGVCASLTRSAPRRPFRYFLRDRVGARGSPRRW
jgi:TIR domain